MKHWLILLILALAAMPVWASNAGEYLLGPGDVVKISVYDSPDLALEAPLSKSGALNFPLLGPVPLAGLTVDQADKLIADRLKSGNLVKSPQVSMIVTQYRSQLISAIGEFNRPGLLPLDHPTDLMQVIALAGGIAVTGSDIVEVIRGPQTIHVSLTQLMAETDPAKRTIVLSSGDVVYVPRAMIYVYGEVNRPGNYRLEPDMTTMEAISVAGGLTTKASKRSITIHRDQSDGTITTLPAGLSDKLKVGDVIEVPESWF
jgi:polysaccharide export outer membrane protein